MTPLPRGREAKLKWDRLSHLAPNKLKARARTEHELVSSLDPDHHPNHLTNFPSRDNYIINHKWQIYAHKKYKGHNHMVLQFRILHLRTGMLKKISHQTSHVPSLFWMKVINYKIFEQGIIVSFTSQSFFLFLNKCF